MGLLFLAKLLVISTHVQTTYGKILPSCLLLVKIDGFIYFFHMVWL